MLVHGATLVFALLAATSPAAETDRYAHPEADALALRLMDAVGAEPANCPAEAFLPFSVVLCGKPAKEFRQDRDALRRTVEEVMGSLAASGWKQAGRGEVCFFLLRNAPVFVGITRKGHLYLRYFWQVEECLPETTDDLFLTGEGAKIVDPVPIPETKTPVVYPDLARRARLEAGVLVQARISKEGRTEAACVMHTNRPNVGFEEAVLQAVNEWRWRPATIGGRPVPFTMTLIVEFHLEQ